MCFCELRFGGPIWGAPGGSQGPHGGRFSKRMFHMNSRHQDEAIDTKLDAFLWTSILGGPYGGHPRRPQDENQKSGSERRWGLPSSIITSSFVAIHRVLRNPYAFFDCIATTEQEQAGLNINYFLSAAKQWRVSMKFNETFTPYF